VAECIESTNVELNCELVLKPGPLKPQGLSARTCAYFNYAKLVSQWVPFVDFGRLPPSFYGGLVQLGVTPAIPAAHLGRLRERFSLKLGSWANLR
jgi:hypothetical protein